MHVTETSGSTASITVLSSALDNICEIKKQTCEKHGEKSKTLISKFDQTLGLNWLR
jgi:hypothetical protein